MSALALLCWVYPALDLVMTHDESGIVALTLVSFWVACPPICVGVHSERPHQVWLFFYVPWGVTGKLARIDARRASFRVAELSWLVLLSHIDVFRCV